VTPNERSIMQGGARDYGGEGYNKKNIPGKKVGFEKRRTSGVQDCRAHQDTVNINDQSRLSKKSRKNGCPGIRETTKCLRIHLHEPREKSK